MTLFLGPNIVDSWHFFFFLEAIDPFSTSQFVGMDTNSKNRMFFFRNNFLLLITHRLIVLALLGTKRFTPCSSSSRSIVFLLDTSGSHTSWLSILVHIHWRKLLLCFVGFSVKLSLSLNNKRIHQIIAISIIISQELPICYTHQRTKDTTFI